MNPRVGLSTISFRFRPFEEALDLISQIGVTRIDLGAIPDVTDHVPVPFTGSAADYREKIAARGLSCGAVNADLGDFNDPDLDRDALAAIARPLIGLAKELGAALIVAVGRQNWEPFVSPEADDALILKNLDFVADLCDEQGVRLMVEILHHKRWVHSVEHANRLIEKIDPARIGILFDTAHVVASEDDVVAWAKQIAPRVERVHFRDAVPGNLNVGIGRGDVDFDGVIREFEAGGFTGDYILELETHDVEEEDRYADAERSVAVITEILAKYEK